MKVMNKIPLTNLPEGLAGGDYVLDTEASISEKAFLSSFEFSVKKEQVAEEIRFIVEAETEPEFFEPIEPTIPHFSAIKESDLGDVVRMDGA